MTSEEISLRQKARLIGLGDGNTKLFHYSLKSKKSIKRIDGLIRESGEIIKKSVEIQEMIREFYMQLLSPPTCEMTKIDVDLVKEGAILPTMDTMEFIAHVSNSAIDQAMSNIQVNKITSKFDNQAIKSDS